MINLPIYTPLIPLFRPSMSTFRMHRPVFFNLLHQYLHFHFHSLPSLIRTPHICLSFCPFIPSTYLSIYPSVCLLITVYIRFLDYSALPIVRLSDCSLARSPYLVPLKSLTYPSPRSLIYFKHVLVFSKPPTQIFYPIIPNFIPHIPQTNINHVIAPHHLCHSRSSLSFSSRPPLHSCLSVHNLFS